MRIHVNGKGFELRSDLRNEVVEKIETALDRFRQRVVNVRVFLEDVNGPKHGPDKSLRLIIDLERMPLVVVEETGEVWQAMLDQVVERAAHTVSRHLDRLRSWGDRTSMAGDTDHSLQA